MSATAEFVSYVRDLLAPLGQLSDGKFFGGHAIKHNGNQFAMVMGNTLYFRVSDGTRAQYEERGSRPFAYSTKNGVVQVKKYYAAPEELLENQEQLLAWAKQAINATSGA
jgi:DNA transformation protein and related proteins